MRAFFVNILSACIPVKKYRRQFRERFSTACPVRYNPQEEAEFVRFFNSKNFRTVLLQNGVRLFQGCYVDRGAKIGRRTYLNMYSYIEGNVTLGRYCSVGMRCVIGASAHPTEFLSTSPEVYHARTLADWNPVCHTQIGHDVWVGAGAIVKGGVKIGNGAIIGAGAVVTKDVPPYAIVGGVPARVLRYRFDEATIEQLEKSAWWELPHEKIIQLPYTSVAQSLAQLNNKK